MAGKIVEPRVHIPPLIEQGDTPSWVDFPFTDAEGILYDASGYTLTYVIAGAAAPLPVVAEALGVSWRMSLTAAQTNGLPAGKNWWQAQLSASNFAITVARGDLVVVANLAVASAGFSGLTASEQSLAAWEGALAALTGTAGPAVESYRIGDREMRYRNMPEILQAIAYWNAKVINERTANSIAQNKGNPRKLYARFPSRFGTSS